MELLLDATVNAYLDLKVFSEIEVHQCVGVNESSEMPGPHNEYMWCINGGTVSGNSTGITGFLVVLQTIVCAQTVILVSMVFTVNSTLMNVMNFHHV